MAAAAWTREGHRLVARRVPWQTSEKLSVALEDVDGQRHLLAKPCRKRRVLLECIVRQRVDQDVEGAAMFVEPRNHPIELVGVEGELATPPEVGAHRAPMEAAKPDGNSATR